MKTAIWLYRAMWCGVAAILYMNMPFFQFGVSMAMVAIVVYLKETITFGNYSNQLTPLKDATVAVIDAQRERIAQLEGEDKTGQ